jgi:hypothetical protein
MTLTNLVYFQEILILTVSYHNEQYFRGVTESLEESIVMTSKDTTAAFFHVLPYLTFFIT